MHVWREKTRKPEPVKVDQFRNFLPVGELTAIGLDKTRHYIAFCDSGERSATAAYLIGARDLIASAISGGINACSRLPAG